MPDPVRISYGERTDQWADLHLPAGDGPVPVVVVVHGGFWRQMYDARLGTPISTDLANAGYAAWNLEYARVGGDGGWPTTFADVAAGIDALASSGQRRADGRLDLTRVVVVGHSAGGHLAAWTAARHRLPSGAVGADPVVRPIGAVSQAGVLDLVDAVEQGVGSGAVSDLLGGAPDEVPDRYGVASPIALLPSTTPVVCVHGTADGIVPIRQSERFVAAAGSSARLVRLDGVDHFALIDPGSAAWAACRDAVAGLLAG